MCPVADRQSERTDPPSEADVGKSKALVAADFIMKRVPGVKVTAHHSKIQDHPLSFYKQFNIIIAGLDSISARRWINATLVGMVDEEDPESLKPLIDGGTEGFKGQARVILPTITSCYECSVGVDNCVHPLTSDRHAHPTHCIPHLYHCQHPPTPRALHRVGQRSRVAACLQGLVLTSSMTPNIADKKLDTDDPDHIEWLFQVASNRAAEFKIEGVTWALTQGVVKNIIPAIASTNAIIAASCCNEALKIATTCAPFLNNYMMVGSCCSLVTPQLTRPSMLATTPSTPLLLSTRSAPSALYAVASPSPPRSARTGLLRSLWSGLACGKTCKCGWSLPDGPATSPKAPLTRA